MLCLSVIPESVDNHIRLNIPDADPEEYAEVLVNQYAQCTDAMKLNAHLAKLEAHIAQMNLGERIGDYVANQYVWGKSAYHRSLVLPSPR